MLLAMLLTWVCDGKPHYPSMDANQHIAYISDVGAEKLKPLFIAMGAVTVVIFDISFIAERWLRHTGRLAHNTSMWQKVLSFLTIIFSIIGAAGLILLTIFDTLRHPRLHNGFLVIFIGGYIISAIFICWEYQRLGIHYREHSTLRMSFWVKLAFIIVEVALAIGFGVMSNKHHYNTAAVLEWVIALVFTFYVLSFFMDFIPAVRTKHHQSHETEEQMAMRESAIAPGTHGDQYSNANGYSAGRHYANGNPYGNGIVNGTAGPRGDTYYPDGQPHGHKPADGGLGRI